MSSVLGDARQWPQCIQCNRVTKYTFPLKPVYIGETLSGIESRQKISDIARGARIEGQFRWISDRDGEIAELYQFIHIVAEGAWNIFRLDESNIPCLIPGWVHYSAFLPSPYWRIDAPAAGGFPMTPVDCCRIDFELTLINVLLDQSYYSEQVYDEDLLFENLDDPLNLLPQYLN